MLWDRKRISPCSSTTKLTCSVFWASKQNGPCSQIHILHQWTKFMSPFIWWQSGPENLRRNLVSLSIKGTAKWGKERGNALPKALLSVLSVMRTTSKKNTQMIFLSSNHLPGKTASQCIVLFSFPSLKWFCSWNQKFYLMVVMPLPGQSGKGRKMTEWDEWHGLFPFLEISIHWYLHHNLCHQQPCHLWKCPPIIIYVTRTLNIRSTLLIF